MARPRLLDLFCGAGGAAVGYHRAGFDVVGVDIARQPHYPFEFHEADALTYPLDGFDAIHASPPCQAFSRATAWRGDRKKHPNLIAAIRWRLVLSSLPYVIENVQEARTSLRDPILICGSMLGSRVRRHRYFETTFGVRQPGRCRHVGLFSFDHGGKAPESAYRRAMQCEWMTVHESRQAIPPVYTHFVGMALADHVRQLAKAA